MDDALPLALAGTVGLALGALFFGGLWWTVRLGLRGRRPSLWFLASLPLRLTIVLAGLFVIGREHWERLLTCLLGIVVARVIVSGWIQRRGAGPSNALESDHAP